MREALVIDEYGHGRSRPFQWLVELIVGNVALVAPWVGPMVRRRSTGYWSDISEQFGLR